MIGARTVDDYRSLSLYFVCGTEIKTLKREKLKVQGIVISGIFLKLAYESTRRGFDASFSKNR